MEYRFSHQKGNKREEFSWIRAAFFSGKLKSICEALAWNTILWQFLMRGKFYSHQLVSGTPKDIQNGPTAFNALCTLVSLQIQQSASKSRSQKGGGPSTSWLPQHSAETCEPAALLLAFPAPCARIIGGNVAFLKCHWVINPVGDIAHLVYLLYQALAATCRLAPLFLWNGPQEVNIYLLTPIFCNLSSWHCGFFVSDPRSKPRCGWVKTVHDNPRVSHEISCLEAPVFQLHWLIQKLSWLGVVVLEHLGSICSWELCHLILPRKEWKQSHNLEANTWTRCVGTQVSFTSHGW